MLHSLFTPPFNQIIDNPFRLNVLLIVFLTMLSSNRMLFGQNETYYTHPAPGYPALSNPHYNNTGTPRSSINCNNLDTDPCPFDDEPILHIPVNIHFVMTLDGKGNFSETGDGDGDMYNGYQRAEDIVNLANEQLEINYPVWAIQPTPAVCDIRMRLVLQGVYFHRTNHSLVSTSPVQYDRSAFWAFINSNMVNPGTESNCFFFNNELDDGTSGQANGAHVTVLSDWLNYINHEKPTLNTSNPNFWYRNFAARVLLHEIFHNSGLWAHPYQIDPCDDTPTLPPCWNYVENGPPPCNDWANISNNLMDYNQWINEWSLSPCQICRLHEYAPLILIQDENEGECAPLSAFFDLPSQVCGTYQLQVWMQGSASYNENSHFIEIYEVSSVGSTTVAGNYQSDWFDGPVGRINLGSYIDYTFGCNKVYRVKLAVSNDCNDWDEMVRYVTTKCICDVVGEPYEEEIDTLYVTPNPADINFAVNYKLHIAQNLTLSVYDVYGGQLIGILKDQEWTDTDPHTHYWNVDAIPDGLYFVRAVTNTQAKTIQFAVQH